SRVYEQEEKKRRRSTMMFGGLAIIAAGYALLQSTNWLYFIALLFILFGLSSWLLGKRSLADMRRLLQTEEQSIDQMSLGQEELAELKRQLERQKKLKTNRTNLQNNIKMNTMDEMKLDERNRVHQERKQRWLQQVQEQCDRYLFLKEIEVAYWPELYHRLETLLEASRELEEEDQAAQSLQHQVVEYEQKLFVFMEGVNGSKEERSNPNALLTQLESMIETYETQAKELQESKMAMSETVEQLKDVQEK